LPQGHCSDTEQLWDGQTGGQTEYMATSSPVLTVTTKHIAEM